MFTCWSGTTYRFPQVHGRIHAAHGRCGRGQRATSAPMRSTSCFVGPAARQKNVAYKAKRRRSRTKLAVRTSPGRTIRIAAAPVSKRDHAEYAVRIIVRARCKEELVVCAVRAAILAELQCPNLIDLDSFAIRVAKRTDELTRFRIERVDPASGSVVADQNRVAHRAEISGSQRDAPGRMERAIGREVFHQITLGIKNVHKATCALFRAVYVTQMWPLMV